MCVVVDDVISLFLCNLSVRCCFVDRSKIEVCWLPAVFKTKKLQFVSVVSVQDVMMLLFYEADRAVLLLLK